MRLNQVFTLSCGATQSSMCYRTQSSSRPRSSQLLYVEDTRIVSLLATRATWAIARRAQRNASSAPRTPSSLSMKRKTNTTAPSARKATSQPRAPLVKKAVRGDALVTKATLTSSTLSALAACVFFHTTGSTSTVMASLIATQSTLIQRLLRFQKKRKSNASSVLRACRVTFTLIATAAQLAHSSLSTSMTVVNLPLNVWHAKKELLRRPYLTSKSSKRSQIGLIARNAPLSRLRLQPKHARCISASGGRT